MANDLMLTTPQAAERLNVTTARVRQFILEGRLPSQQFGRDHLINESDLALLAKRKVGRPPKPKDESATATGGAEAVTTAETPATAAAPLTPKVKAAPKAKRAKKAAVAAPKKAIITAEKRTTKAKGKK